MMEVFPDLVSRVCCLCGVAVVVVVSLSCMYYTVEQVEQVISPKLTSNTPPVVIATIGYPSICIYYGSCVPVF